MKVTLPLPANLTAFTGMDALAHCLEAFCSNVFHPLSQGIALEGIAIVKKYLVRAYKDGNDIVFAGIIKSICPLSIFSMELIRGLAWDSRLENNLEILINSLLFSKIKIYLETSSDDSKIDNILNSLGWENKEERILLGKSIMKRQKNTKLTTIKSEFKNILGSIEQAPDLQSPSNIQSQ